MTSKIECQYKEFEKYSSDDLVKRFIELISMDKDDIINKRVFNIELIEIKRRFRSNERLRRLILSLRDNPTSLTPERVIEKLIDATEDLKA